MTEYPPESDLDRGATPELVPMDDASMLDGWTACSRDWLTTDGAHARETPRFFRPAKAPRLEAIAALRARAWDAIQRDQPQTAEELALCLTPAFSAYASWVFDAMAEAKLDSSGGRVRPSAYRRWLVQKCLTAVVEDVCRMTIGQFAVTVLYLGQRMPDVAWPEKAARARRAAWRLFAEEVIPREFTRRLETDLNLMLTEQRVPFWEGRLDGQRQEHAAHSTESVAPDSESGPPTPQGVEVAPGLNELVRRAAKRDADAAARRKAFMVPHLRPVTKLSMNALAENAEIGQSSFSRWYHGRCHLSKDNIKKLGAFLKLDPGQKIPN